MRKWNRIQYQPNLPLGADGRRVTASPEHIALSREAVKEGMVLLKNENGALPLARGVRIALFGKGTCDYVKGGGGSGDVTVPYVRNLADGFARYPDRVCVFEETTAFYRAYVAAQYAEGREPGMLPEPELPDALVRRAAAFADTAVISISRFSSEGWDRKGAFEMEELHTDFFSGVADKVNALFPKGDFLLTDSEAAMVQKVCGAFDRVVVVLNVGSVCDVEWFRENPAIDAALLGWQAGLEGGLAEAELLLGIGNPSGRLADTFARTLEDYPSSATFYESNDHVDYTEDIYVGYRYFETLPGARARVSYPFGYGLSYTTFELASTVVRPAGDDIEVRTAVTNTGNAAGRQVIQVYFSAPQGRLGKPARQLAAYQKTRLLQPGETQRIVLRFPVDSMASYDDTGAVQASAWVLEAGDYRFFVGTDVRAAAESAWSCHLSEDRVVRQLERRLAPTRLAKRLRADGSWEALPQVDAEPEAPALPLPPLANADGLAPGVRAVAPRNFFAPDGNAHTLQEVADGAVSLAAFTAQLSDEQLAWTLGGQPNTGVANTFGYGNLPEFGVPNVMTADGPAGLRLRPEVGVQTTAFPCATLLACAWDPEVCEAVGRAAAEEVRENNIGVWLAPAINIHRNPLCGRNFEYFSEDPLLTARQAGAMVRGIQSTGIAATIKHFALNNKETNRRNSDSRASERAIREIYLRAFELVIRETDPWSLMTSYNLVNGQRASENGELLNGILRGEWGYEGLVTTDWWNFAEQYREIAAGNDVKMGCGFPERLLEALRLGGVTRAQLETAARRVFRLILKLE